MANAMRKVRSDNAHGDLSRAELSRIIKDKGPFSLGKAPLLASGKVKRLLPRPEADVFDRLGHELARSDDFWIAWKRLRSIWWT